MSKEIISAAIFGAVGLLFIGLGWPLAASRIGPNAWYGFRTTRTLADPATWYAANRIAGIDMIIAGAVLVAGTIVLLLVRSWAVPSLPIGWLGLAILVIVTAVFVTHGFWALARL